MNVLVNLGFEYIRLTIKVLFEFNLRLRQVPVCCEKNKNRGVFPPQKIFGSGNWTRTSDIRINSPLFYRLNYARTVLLILYLKKRQVKRFVKFFVINVGRPEFIWVVAVMLLLCVPKYTVIQEIWSFVVKFMCNMPVAVAVCYTSDVVPITTVVPE